MWLYAHIHEQLFGNFTSDDDPIRCLASLWEKGRLGSIADSFQTPARIGIDVGTSSSSQQLQQRPCQKCRGVKKGLVYCLARGHTPEARLVLASSGLSLTRGCTNCPGTVVFSRGIKILRTIFRGNPLKIGTCVKRQATV